MQAWAGRSRPRPLLVGRVAEGEAAGGLRRDRQARAQSDEGPERPIMRVDEQRAAAPPVVRLPGGACLGRIDDDRPHRCLAEANGLARAAGRPAGDAEKSQDAASAQGSVAGAPMLMVRLISSVFRPSAIGRVVSARTAVS